ncbi:MAG TPA: phosphoribosyltransferase family protein [Mycobacteriales bacterium]|jgi:predicted amidophosphoribosyltransferase|nr:phosphoribosyltransferase family protein [Mycobacteriales bacterium]
MGLLDLICPTRCSGCGTPASLVCGRCAVTLAAPAVRHVPTPCPAGMPPTWVASEYDGPVRSMLIEFKERGAVGLAAPLGEVVARCLTAAVTDSAGGLLVVPVPSAAATVRRRGDDVIRLLAEHAARRLRAGDRRYRVAAVLRQRRPVADSAGLSSSARATNLAGALEVRRSAVPRVRGATVLIVDDLVTTGATLVAATEALSGAGACVLGAAAVAATRRRKTVSWAAGGIALPSVLPR